MGEREGERDNVRGDFFCIKKACRKKKIKIFDN